MRHPVELTREVLGYRNQYVRVYDDEVELSDGSPGHYVRIDQAAEGRGVVVLAISGVRIALVRTFRYPIGRWQWALPRGFSKGAASEDTARNEAAEELGAEDPIEVRVIGSTTPDSGILAGTVDIVLMRLAAEVAQPTDTREVAEIRWVTLSEVLAAVAQGEIDDGFTLAALTIAQAAGILPAP